MLFVPRTATITDYAMNTVVSVTVRSHSAAAAAQKAIDEVKRIESLMSATVPGSDVYRINSAGAGASVQVSGEVYELIQMSLNVSDITDGAFDITVNPLSELWDFNAADPKVPDAEDIAECLSLVSYRDIALNPAQSSVTLAKEGMSISLGAVAKGYAADRAAQILRDEGVHDAIVDLGGNIYAIGSKRIGIQTPFKSRGEYFTTVDAEDCSVVTSGSYERYFAADDKIYHHIIDPGTGYPSASGLKSATVVSKSSALADALSTALFVAGEDRADSIVSSFDGVYAVLLTEDNRTIEVGTK